MNFIKDYEMNEMFRITGFSEEEIIADYKLYVEAAELEIDRDSWIEYMEETRTFF